MIEIGLGHYLTLGAVIFFLGVIGIFLNRKNIIVILMSVCVCVCVCVCGGKYKSYIFFNFFRRHIRSDIYNVDINCGSSRGSNWFGNNRNFYRNRGSIRVEDIHGLKG